MKFIHPLFEKPVELIEDKITVLVIEDVQKFRNFINDVYQQVNLQGEGALLISDEGKRLNPQKQVELITDFFSLDMNQKKIISKLYQRLEELAMDSEYYMMTQELLSHIQKYVATIIDDEDIHLEYLNDINIQEIFKVAKVKVKNKEIGILEKFIDYVSTVQEYIKPKCFVIVNMHQFFAENELKEIYQFIKYHKINVLLVENESSTIHNPDEIFHIIDEDLCEIY